MKIKISTIIEIDRDVEDQITESDIEEAYAEFREIIKNTYENNDITYFSFINIDSGHELESEVEEFSERD